MIRGSFSFEKNNMSNLITKSLATRLRAFDWNFEYTEDQSVWRRCASDLNTLRAEALNNTIEQNNKVLEELLKLAQEGDNPGPVDLIKFTIAHQLTRKFN